MGNGHSGQEANYCRHCRKENTAKNTQSSPAPAEGKKGREYQFEFLDADSLAAQRIVKLSGIEKLEGTSSGYADSIHKGDVYLVRFGAGPEQRQNVVRVRSRCVPEVFYPSDNSLLVGRCPLAGNDSNYVVSAFTVTGRRLWRQHGSQHRYFPAIARNQDGSRFAISTVVRSAPLPSPANSDDENDDNVTDTNHGLEQNIQVFETASGTAIQSVSVSPVVMSGQNFSLSPDGRWLAVLHDSELEFYDLPAMSEEERAKFTALKADVPGLYIVSSKSGEDSELETEPWEENAEATAERANMAPQHASTDQASAEQTQGNANQDPSDVDNNFAADAPLPVPTATAAASAGEDAGGPVATFKTSTQAVVVDVVVTDSKGHPVNELHQQDFQVTEDGKPQNLRYFKEVNGAQTAPDAATVPAAVKPSPPLANVFNNNTDAPDPGSVTLVLLDLLNTPSADQEHAREQLINFLKTKNNNSQFALCTLSSGRALHLRLIQGFTPDENLILAAVNGKNGAPQAARWQEAAAETANSVDAVNELAQEGPTGGWAALLHGLQVMQSEQQVTDTDARVGITIDALTQLARYLSGIPGRKNLVWLSGSFPILISPGADFDNPNSDNRNYISRLSGQPIFSPKHRLRYIRWMSRVHAGDDVVSASSKGVGSRGTATAPAPGSPRRTKLCSRRTRPSNPA